MRAQSKQVEIDKSNAEWWAEISQAKSNEPDVLQSKGPAPKYRRALAPFSTVSQKDEKIEECSSRAHMIEEALKKDRDAKFARMCTWKITKKVARD